MSDWKNQSAVPAVRAGRSLRARVASALLIPLGLGPACAASGAAAAPGLDAQPAPSERVRVDLSRHFQAFGAEGAFLLYDAAGDRLLVHEPERAQRRVLPASTFKILNSLIALETGVLRDEREVIAWDGVDRGNPDWNRDHRMATAFQASAVWFYQEVARRIGEGRMREWVERVGYGNADIDGGIDRFWLDGELRISPEEQIDLLRRLHGGILPFSERSQAIVRRVMRMEEGDGYVLSGKTGWARQGGMNYGWLVGWVEREGNTYLYATQIESGESGFPMRRAQQAITRGVLRELGVLP